MGTGIKRKVYVLIFTCLTALNQNIAAYPDIPDNIDDTDGPVASLRVFEEPMSEETGTEQPEPTLRLEIEREPRTGKILKQRNYDGSGNFQWENTYLYTADGNLKEWSSRDVRGRLKWRYHYFLSADGNIEKKVHLSGSEKIESTTIYQYEDNKLSEELLYNSSGALQWSRRYTYYRDGNVEISTYYPDGSRIKTIRRVFNSSNLEIREVHTDELGATFEDVHFVYDDSDRIVEVRVYDGFGRLRELRLIQYNSTGDILRKVKDFPFENRVSEYVYAYTYDDRANWTERTTLYYVHEDDKDKRLVSRTRVTRDIMYAEE